MITQQEYLRHKGMICPHCRSSHIAADMAPIVEGIKAEQQIECLDCLKTWRDRYRLTGFATPNQRNTHAVPRKSGSASSESPVAGGVRADERTPQAAGPK